MRRPSPPSRLKRAWLALGLVLLAVIGWRFWPESTVPEGALIALPETPETLALPDPEAGNTVPDTAPPTEAPATLPTVSRAARPAADATEAGVTDAASRGVRITLAGGEGTDGTGNARVALAPAAVPPAAPDPALTARTEAGLAPQVSADGRTPFTAYRRLQAPAETEDRAVAVLLSGLGFDDALARRAVALPPEISLSFVPYARRVGDRMEAARAAGHEVLIELPMMQRNASGETLGPAVLDPARDASGNARRLDWLLSRSPAYPMATNYLGGAVTGDTALAGQLMARLGRAGLGYIDETGRLADAARAAGVPYAAVDVVAGPGEVAAALRQAARAPSDAPSGVGLVKLYATEESLSALEAWVAERAPGTLVPASSKADAP